MTTRRIYMDHAATTPVRPEVLAAMLPYLKEHYGNPSSLHAFGRAARKAVDEAREKTAAAIGADSKEIIFTSGGTHADNLAIIGAAHAFRDRKGRQQQGHIITSAIEHHAVLDTCLALEKEGFAITFLPVDRYGMIDLQQLQDALREDTFLISIMAANNEVGTLQPLEEIGRLAAGRGILFHTDAVQAIGNIPIDVRRMNIDLLSLSAHKFNGPKGVGALFWRQGTKLKCLFHGGGQESRMHPGTENVAGMVGLGRAIELAVSEMPDKTVYVAGLRDRLIDGLLKIKDVWLNGHPQKRLPGNVNVSFGYIEGESLLLSLDLKGVAASSGSACTSGSLEPSHVLLAMGLEHREAQGSLRFSLGRENTGDEIDFVLSIMPQIVERLRKMSSVYMK